MLKILSFALLLTFSQSLLANCHHWDSAVTSFNFGIEHYEDAIGFYNNAVDTDSLKDQCRWIARAKSAIVGARDSFYECRIQFYEAVFNCSEEYSEPAGENKVLCEENETQSKDYYNEWNDFYDEYCMLK